MESYCFVNFTVTLDLFMLRYIKKWLVKQKQPLEISFKIFSDYLNFRQKTCILLKNDFFTGIFQWFSLKPLRFILQNCFVEIIYFL